MFRRKKPDLDQVRAYTSATDHFADLADPPMLPTVASEARSMSSHRPLPPVGRADISRRVDIPGAQRRSDNELSG